MFTYAKSYNLLYKIIYKYIYLHSPHSCASSSPDVFLTSSYSQSIIFSFAKIRYSRHGTCSRKHGTPDTALVRENMLIRAMKYNNSETVLSRGDMVVLRNKIQHSTFACEDAVKHATKYGTLDRTLIYEDTVTIVRHLKHTSYFFLSIEGGRPVNTSLPLKT